MESFVKNAIILFTVGLLLFAFVLPPKHQSGKSYHYDVVSRDISDDLDAIIYIRDKYWDEMEEDDAIMFEEAIVSVNLYYDSSQFIFEDEFR